MTKRIFICVIALAVSMVSVGMVAMLIVTVGVFAIPAVLWQARYPVLLIFTGCILLSVLLAWYLSRRTVRPLRDLDFDHPEQADVGEELKPVIGRIVRQNRRIARQTEELQLRQAEFDAMTVNMREGMVLLDAKAEILACNPAALHLLGAGDGVPRSVLMLNNSSKFRFAVRSALDGERREEVLHLGQRCCNIIATPIIHDEQVTGAVIVILDETEKEKREALRREFTSNVSHELKTPLTSISGFAELIRAGMTSADDTVRFADTIYREAQRLITLVGDIIRLTQLDGSEMPYDDEPVDLGRIARDCAQRLSLLAEKRRITVTVSGDDCFVAGNEQVLEEMVYNLCDNAVKYNREGGTVHILLSHEDGCPTLTVSDSGIGIPADEQGRVFERFYRVDKSHSREIGGTGLGLSIVKHGAAYHGAQIELQSEVDKGTTVRLIFAGRHKAR